MVSELYDRYSQREISSFSALKDKVEQNEHYFFYQTGEGERFVFDLPEVVPLN